MKATVSVDTERVENEMPEDPTPHGDGDLEELDVDQEKLLNRSGPDDSLGTKIGIYLLDNFALVAGVVLLGVYGVLAATGTPMPREAKIALLATGVLWPTVGWWAGKKVVRLLWREEWVYVVSLKAEEKTGGIYRFRSQDFRELVVLNGELDRINEQLYFAREVHLELGVLVGTWRGTMADRELARSLVKMRKWRIDALEDGRRGFVFEALGSTLVENAVRKISLRVVKTMHTGQLPDRGDGFVEAIDDALKSYDLESMLNEIDRQDHREEREPSPRSETESEENDDQEDSGLEETPERPLAEADD